MNKSEHTFYKEAKKSFLGEDSFSWKQARKTFFKYFKWFLYAFLTVTTLWGCVNQFRHSTSGAVSQGIEFYSNYDSVLPNLYNGKQSTHTYSIEHYNSETSTTEMVPLQFYTINPNYDPGNESPVPNVNYEDLFILSSDKTDSNGNPNNSFFTYTFNYNVAAFYLFNYDWSFYNSTSFYNDTNPNGYIWVLPWLELPQYFNTIITDANGDNTISLADFYYYIGFRVGDDSGLLLPDPIYPDDENKFIAESVTNAFIVPSIQKSEQTSDWWNTKDNWEVISGESTHSISQDDWNALTPTQQDDYVYNQVVYFTNVASFLMSRSVSCSEEITVNVINPETNLPETKSGSIQQVIGQAYYGDSTYVSPINYVADFAPLQDISLYDISGTNDYNLYSGIGYSIVSQSKSHPLYPTPEAIKTFQSGPDGIPMRSPTWYENSSAGTQQRTDNAGWVLLDDNGDFIEIKNRSDDSVEYLYGDTQDEFNNNLNSYRTSSNSTDQYYVDTQANFSFGIYSTDNSTESITNLAIQEKEDFIGMSSVTTVHPLESDSSKTLQTVTYNSTMYDSIVQSGQSGNNSKRDIFAGWGDWGDAWSPDYGPMYGLFVFPLAELSLFVNSWFSYAVFGAWGVILGIFIITFLLRGIGLLLSLGSSKSQSRMQEVQPIIAEINAKYAGYDKSNKQMKMKKQQETMAIYKKYEVNPFSSIGTIFITLPIFLSLFTIISAIPIYKTATVGAFSFSVSSFYGMFNIPSMFIIYLMVGISVGFAQGISSKVPGWLSNKRRGIKQVDDATKAAMKKQRKMQNILIGVFVFIGLTVSVLLAIYWIFSALFSILNELVRHWIKESKAKKIKAKAKGG